MIPPEKIDEIFARIDILDLISSYVTLKRSGKNYKGLCPFHVEKTPSFMVNPERGIFKCFGCGEGGGPAQFLMKIEGIDFFEAMKILAGKAGVTLSFTQADQRKATEKENLFKILKTAADFYYEILMNNPIGKNALSYLKKRGMDPKTIAKFQLGFAPGGGDFLVRHLRNRKYEYEMMERAGIVMMRNRDYYDYFRERVIFSITDSKGQIIGMAGRTMDDSVSPKYINTPETQVFSKSNILYGLHLAKAPIRKEDEVFVVEGYMDAISLHTGGIENVVASMGTSLTEEQSRLISRYTGRVIFAYDADAAGSAATVRGIEIFEKAGLYVKIMSMPRGEDPDSIIRKKGANFFRQLAANASSVIDFKINHLKSLYDLNSPEGKEAFVREIAPVLKEIKGDVRRSEYIRIISEKFRLPEDILRKKVEEKKIRKKGVDISPVFKKSKLSLPEKLLANLLANPRFIPLCKDYRFNENHLEPDLLNLYRGLQEADTKGMEFIKVDILGRICKSDEMLKRAVELSMVEGLPPCTEEEIRALLEGIEIQYEKRRCEELGEMFKRGEITPQNPEFEEWMTLIKKIKVRNL